MLEVGIHENVYLSKDTGLTDKGALKIVLTKSQAADIDAFTAFTTGQSLATDDAGIIIFPPDTMNFEKTEKVDAITMTKRVQVVEGQLKKILLVYMTEEAVEKAIGDGKSYAGLGLNKDNFETKMKDDSFIGAVINNLGKLFLEACVANKLYKKGDGFRIKLIRTSKNKHYPKLSAGFDTWIEGMDVTKEASKIAYSSYEKSKKLDSALPVPSEGTPKPEAASADALFKPDTSINETFPDKEDKPPII